MAERTDQAPTLMNEQPLARYVAPILVAERGNRKRVIGTRLTAPLQVSIRDRLYYERKGFHIASKE